MAINEISWNTESDSAADLISNPALVDFKDVNGLAKAFIDTKALVGNSIRVPSKEAPADDMAAFYASLQEKVPGLMPKPDPTDEAAMNALMTSLGKPEKLEGYVVPEGVEFEEGRLSVLKDTAFKLGLTGKQFDKWANDISVAEKEATTARKESTQQEIQGLMNEWGTAFDNKYAKAIKVAEATNAPPEVVKALKEKTAGVATIKWFDGLVGALGSEDFQLATQPPGSGGITPVEARARAGEIRNKIAQMNESHPEYQPMIKKMMDFDALGKGAS